VRVLLISTLLAALPGLAVAAPLPAEVARMIEAAAETPGALATVAEVARRTHPESLDEIDAQVGALTSRAEEERIARITSLRFRDGWKGEGQAGGFISTGNSDDIGGSAGLTFAKETLRWRHEVKMAGDYQRSDGEVSKERYFAGYAGQWKLNARAFVALSATGERDRFAGFSSRFTESVGFGYRLLDRHDLRLDVQAGPALRQTNYYDLDDEIAFSGRLGGDLAWTIRPDLVFTQNATLFLDSVSSSLTATTALTTKLRGDLSARASFDIRVEAEPPADREHTDTTTRATLVYSF
jgi:putative salt-induced outer membrane protein